MDETYSNKIAPAITIEGLRRVKKYYNLELARSLLSRTFVIPYFSHSGGYEYPLIICKKRSLTPASVMATDNGKRKLKNWIKGFQYWMQESEAPDSYITWAAVSAIAGATRRQIYTEWVYYEFYTNMYIVLVGPPGIVHKSSVIGQIRKIYNTVGIPTISESITREGMIDQAIERSTNGAAALTAFPDEFSDFIRPSGANMLEFLTTIFGSPDEWEYTTRGHKTKRITKAFINILAGTTPSWIQDEFDISFTEKGFASRTLFVEEQEPRFHKAHAKITPDMRRIHENLIVDLAHIAELEGCFSWPKDSYDWWEKWYEKELPQERQNADYRLKGFVARKPTHLLKLAQVLSLAERDDLVLDLKYLKKGKEMLDDLSFSMARTFSAVGRNEYASDLERIYYELLLKGEMSKGQVVERNRSAMTLEMLEQQMVTLEIMGYIRTEKRGKDTWYIAIPRET